MDNLELRLDRVFSLFSLPTMNRCSCYVCSNITINWDKEKIIRDVARGRKYFLSPTYCISLSNIYARCILNLQDGYIKTQYMDGCQNLTGPVKIYDLCEVMDLIKEEDLDFFIFNIDLFK